jgi:thiosulfate/3-mercaptopyruvate sulfurtransferase
MWLPERMTAGIDTARAAVLVTAHGLAEAMRGEQPPAVLDVRWALGGPDGYQDYLAAHIPGARFADLEAELAAPAAADLGRHPLPDIGDLQRAARGWGLTRGQSVIVYDATGAQAAARAWWVLRWAGVANVRILDGGLPAWIQAGFDVESGPPGSSGGTSPDRGSAAHVPPGGDVVLSAGHLPVVEADAAARLARTGVLLDARAAARYRGEVEPIDPRAGHIPGAVSAPTTENLNDDATFRSSAELRHRFAELGATGDVGVYCGSGVTAAHEIAALAVAGVPAALYAGSWSQWSADLDRDAAVGADPG